MSLSEIVKDIQFTREDILFHQERIRVLKVRGGPSHEIEKEESLVCELEEQVKQLMKLLDDENETITIR